MNRKSASLFGIESTSDYLEFCSQAVEEFADDQASVLRGFAAVLALNHVPDWLQHKLNENERRLLCLRDDEPGTPLKDELEQRNPDLGLLRAIANGFKHLRPGHTTERVSGWGMGPWGIGPYGMPYLLIDLGDDRPAASRWDVSYSLCRRVLDWWRQQLQPIVDRAKEGTE